MKKVFCIHHYTPQTRFVSLNEDCSDKHLEPIWFCDKCGRVQPRKLNDYVRTDKPGSRKAWLRIISKPTPIALEILSVLSLVATTVMIYQSADLVLARLLIGAGFFFLGYFIDRANNKDCMTEMVKQGYYTKGEKK